VSFEDAIGIENIAVVMHLLQAGDGIAFW